jgi:hypothetical protein
VVRRKSGNSENRSNGTESKAPTNTEPRPSKTARNERLLSTDNSEGRKIVFFEDLESLAMQSPDAI